MLELGVEIALVDEPAAAVVGEHFSRQEVSVFLEGGDYVLEELPPETEGGRFAVLPDQVLDSDSQVVAIDHVPPNQHPVETSHQHRHSIQYFLPLSRDGGP